MVGRLRNRGALLMVACVVFQIGFVFLVGIKKNLAETISATEWQRLAYAVSAALTKQNLGIGGFVLDGNIVSALFRSGISDDEGLLQPLGLTWPDNFYRTDVVAGAIERAKAAAAEGRPVMLMTFGGEDVGMVN